LAAILLSAIDIGLWDVNSPEKRLSKTVESITCWDSTRIASSFVTDVFTIFLRLF